MAKKNKGGKTESAEAPKAKPVTLAKGATAHGKSQDRKPKVVNHEAIARRAYEIYIERNWEAGAAEKHWAQAERELTKQTKRS